MADKISGGAELDHPVSNGRTAKHIVCFGDFNTHGYCAETGGRFDETERWTRLLQDRLGDDFLIIEEGLGRRTTSFDDPIHGNMSGFEYIHPCLTSHKPADLLIITLGIGDTKERFGSPAARIVLGLKRLINKAKVANETWEDGKPNILVIAPKNIDKRYEETVVVQTMEYGCTKKPTLVPEEFRKMVEQMGCALLGANTVVTEQNHADFMHLIKGGHRELTGALAVLIPGLL